eukprot:m.361761 g.361761  ORF g.361761 m.361761 type:complete len:269 (+) comp19858_c0_seq1:70-876(+)
MLNWQTILTATMPTVPNAVDPGFWGEATATIDWCEANYVVTYYVAEFFNSVSSLVIMFLGLVGVFQWFSMQHEPRFLVLWLLVMFVGFGSTLFHGTLLFPMQLLDELPMVYCLLGFAYCFIERNHTNPKYKTLPTMLVLYAIFWTVMHAYFGFVTAFQVHFAAISIAFTYLSLRAAQTSGITKIKKYTLVYFFVFLIATVAWLTDQHFCSQVQSLQLHAWWHVGTGIAVYYIVVSTIAMRYKSMDLDVCFTKNWLGLPMVVNTDVKLL